MRKMRKAESVGVVNTHMNNLSEQSGITLIVLIITVIVMLILVGVAVSSINGIGLIGKAKTTADLYNNSANDEEDRNETTSLLYNAINGGYTVSGGNDTDLPGGNTNSSEGFDMVNGVNKPKLTTGMIPIYYDGTNWKKADITNPGNQWYDYSITAKQYANICTVADANSHYRTDSVGTVIPVTDMTTMFVWIPRYAYSINAGGYRTENSETVPQTNANSNKKIDVTFLVGTTNKDKSGITYATDYDADDPNLGPGKATPKIVHPGFTFGNQELTGIWVGKFEVSGKNSAGQYVGNSNGSTDAQQYAPDTNTYVQELPNAISWRYITVGESEYQAMKMGTSSQYYGWSNVNTHLIKNSEWGVAAYLAYSQYGQVPEMNGSGKYNSSTPLILYDCYTGAGPQVGGGYNQYTTVPNVNQQYNGSLGKLASTTGNIYGIYDMSGGTFELVAGYLDNKNSELSESGKSTSDPSVVYFENGELKPEYVAYWDKYTVSDEERNGATSASIVTSGGNKTQTQLDDPNTAIKTVYAWNDARKRLSDATFNNMKVNKGIGVNEVTSTYFLRLVGKGKGNKYEWGWFKTLAEADVDTVTSWGGAWNYSEIEIGHNVLKFIMRGRR